MSLTNSQIDTLKDMKAGNAHASNLLAKKNENGIRKFYSEYMRLSRSIEKINSSTTNLKPVVKALNNYKDYVRKKNPFTSQSKFESTIIEEFLCRILKQKFGNDVLRYGSVNAYSSMYFSYPNISEFKRGVEIKINTKNQDVGIFKYEQIKTEHRDGKDVFVPIVCVECKTYLDKTMLEGSIATAQKIKNGNPQCLFLIVTEAYQVSSEVDPLSSQIDGIFILRKQKNSPTNMEEPNPIYAEVIDNLLKTIRKHLNAKTIPFEKILERGYFV